MGWDGMGWDGQDKDKGGRPPETGNRSDTSFQKLSDLNLNKMVVSRWRQKCGDDDMYMACHTQQEIAEAVGVAVGSVNEQIADFFKNDKNADSEIFRDFEQDGSYSNQDEPKLRLTSLTGTTLRPSGSSAQLLFGRFLQLMPTGHKNLKPPRNLTERLFRGYWGFTTSGSKAKYRRNLRMQIWTRLL